MHKWFRRGSQRGRFKQFFPLKNTILIQKGCKRYCWLNNIIVQASIRFTIMLSSSVKINSRSRKSLRQYKSFLGILLK
jgi:hypothetical protein